MIDYDHRHGYRGPEAYLRLPEDAERDAALERLFAETNDGDGLVAAVTGASATEAKAVLADGRWRRSQATASTAARVGHKAGGDPDPARRRDHPRPKGRWEITRAAGGVRFHLRPQDGAVLLVGGWS